MNIRLPSGLGNDWKTIKDKLNSSKEYKEGFADGYEQALKDYENTRNKWKEEKK